MLVSLDYWQFVFLSNLAVVSGEARCFIAAVYTSLKGWGLIGIPLVILRYKHWHKQFLQHETLLSNAVFTFSRPDASRWSCSA